MGNLAGAVLFVACLVVWFAGLRHELVATGALLLHGVLAELLWQQLVFDAILLEWGRWVAALLRGPRGAAAGGWVQRGPSGHGEQPRGGAASLAGVGGHGPLHGVALRPSLGGPGE